MPRRLVLAAAIVLAGGQHAFAGGLEAPAVGHAFVLVGGLVLLFAGLGFWGVVTRYGLKATLERVVLAALGVPLTWMLLAESRALTGFPPWGLMFPLWVVLVVVVLRVGGGLVPGPVRRLWDSLFTARARDTHGSAHFGTARNAARHLAPAAPADAFVLGVMRDAPRGADRRFRQDGHLLTCAPTGAGKGISGVIPNLLEYPGSAFVLDFKGETYAVTARARRSMGHNVILIDPFDITGGTTHHLNWLDTLDPDDPDVVSRAAGLADMLVVAEGADSESHWNDTARELLRGLLVYVAGLPAERRSMAELRRIVTAPEDDLADTLADARRSGTRAPIAGPHRGGPPEPAGPRARLGSPPHAPLHRSPPAPSVQPPAITSRRSVRSAGSSASSPGSLSTFVAIRASTARCLSLRGRQTRTASEMLTRKPSSQAVSRGSPRAFITKANRRACSGVSTRSRTRGGNSMPIFKAIRANTRDCSSDSHGCPPSSTCARMAARNARSHCVVRGSHPAASSRS